MSPKSAPPCDWKESSSRRNTDLPNPNYTPQAISAPAPARFAQAENYAEDSGVGAQKKMAAGAVVAPGG